MAWVVDTSILVDIALPDPKFGVLSAQILNSKLADGLVIAPFSFIELAPLFAGNITELKNFLGYVGIRYEDTFTYEDQELAAKVHSEYVAKKRKGQITKRPIADVLIGTFASKYQGFITRNSKDFKILFPKMKILEP